MQTKRKNTLDSHNYKRHSVMQIFRFSANIVDFVAKKVIFVIHLNLLKQFRGVWEGVGGAHFAQCIFRLFI